MAYVRFVPGFSRHPKRLKCGPISSWLWACSVDYCMEHLTDGFLVAEAVSTLCSNITGSALTRAVNNLVAVGSWEVCPGGYIVHDYLRHNASKTQVEWDREASRQRYQRWMDKRQSNAVATPLANADKTAQQRDSLSICLSDVTTTTSKDELLTQSSSNGTESSHAAKQRRQRALLRTAFPNLEPPREAAPPDA